MTTLSQRIPATLVTLIVCLTAVSGAQAQGRPESENGRYALSPTADGVLRLDTRSGVMSTCTDKGAGWACYAMPDERAALDSEIGRLQADNEALRKETETLRNDADSLRLQLAQRGPAASGKTDEALPKQDSLKGPELKSDGGERKLEIPLPSDRDIDRVMSFLENAWKRLIEMAQRVQKDTSEKL
jgi:hypothetical protein